MPLPSPKPPLEGMTWYSLYLLREYPYSPPNFPNPPALKTKLVFEVEFEDNEAAERLENKVRLLLTSDHAYVGFPAEAPPK